jgi:hypothetical protein
MGGCCKQCKHKVSIFTCPSEHKCNKCSANSEWAGWVADNQGLQPEEV